MGLFDCSSPSQDAMGATAQCPGPAAPKPQYPPPAMPRPGSDHPPPAVLTVAELEAAVAALPGKRDALRKAFDRVAACSPSPLPFAWEDLDAHLSSLQWSISLRFLQLRALEAARPAPAVSAPRETRGDGTGVNPEEEVVVVEREEEVAEQEEEKSDKEMQQCDEASEEEKSDEEMQQCDEASDKIGKDGNGEEEARDEEEEEVVKVAADNIGNEIKDDMDADEEMQVANEEEQSTEDGKKASQDKEDADMEEEEQSFENAKKAFQEEERSMKDAKKASLDKEEHANMEEEKDTRMEAAVTKKASALQGEEQEVCGEKKVEEEEQEAHEEKQDTKNTTKEKGEQAKKVPRDQGSRACPGPVKFNDLAAAFANMDAQRLVELIHTNVGLSSEFHAAMHHAPDGAALTLRVIKLFLHDKTLKTNKVWKNCIGLIRTVPQVVTKLSTESIEKAKWLAKGWREMIDNPQSCTSLGSLASRGLLNFLSSYNIVSEFDTKEIFRIFVTLPRKQQRNHATLFKGLGLADRIPELMDYLVGNGQQVNALYLAPIFNLVEKYPPLSLLKGYVEKAKQTVTEISQKNLTRQSLRAVILKELDNLRMARVAANQQITDSGLRAGIIAEINVLLREFGKMSRSLADASTTTSNPHQQQKESKKKKKRKKAQAQEHHKGQENQQQRQQSKLQQEQQKGQENQQQRQQSKPQQEQLQKEQNKPQQKQEDKPQEKQQQNERRGSKRPVRRCTPKLPARASPAAPDVPLRCNSVQPPYPAMHGVHHGYPTQTGWPGVHCPPAPQLGAPGYVGPLNPFYQRPQFYPQ